MTGMSSRRTTLWSALVGVLTGIVTLAVAEAVAAIMVLPSGSPLFGVGSFVIDIVPGWFKTFVIALFGTGDKVALFVALGILVLVLAVGWASCSTAGRRGGSSRSWSSAWQRSSR